jgi:hypothetical protein
MTQTHEAIVRETENLEILVAERSYPGRVGESTSRRLRNRTPCLPARCGDS